MQAFQLVFEHDHGEDGGAGGNVTGAHTHGVGGHHAGARVTLRRGEGNARLQRAGRVEQLGALFGQRARRSACNQRFRQQVGKLPRLGCDFRNRIELLNEFGFVGVRGRVDREHAGCVANAEHLLAGELPVHVAGEGGEEIDLADVLFVVEHGLVQVCDGPAFRNVVLEQFGKLLVCFGSVGVLPGAERHQQFAIFAEGEVAVHHGGEADASHAGELFAVSVFDIFGERHVCGLQPGPDFFLRIAPQAVFQVAGPAVVAGCDGGVRVVDEHGLDSGGAEFDAQTRLASADFLGGQRDAIVKSLLLRHSFKLLASERLTTTLSTEC